MRTPAKIGVVMAGYLGAALVAWVVVISYIALTPSVDRQASGGMTAFGDSLVFLAVFGIGAFPPTGAAVYWLVRRKQ